ncbi:MAG: UDP-3-O-(3-hydroxymyristoyl)glucosamine N-acyltransferase [Alphaproteobacteria bacterium]|nr:UDP-3-O-(3-hydroxymyristoyl)glucosamine N-acyltransferase [Alphaproteobacteria bacterium]
MTGDARFFARTGPHALSAVAAAAGGVAEGEKLMLTGIAPLQTAGPEELSFLDNRRYLAALRQTRAGAVIVHPDLAAQVPSGTRAIVTKEPYLGWARAACLFFPPPPTRPGVHPTAVIEPGASVDPSAEIGPLAVIGEAAEIGPRCRIGASAVIGAGTVLGADCRIGPLASVTHARLGARVYVYPGARIGQEGFGFAIGPAGPETVPQLGMVLIGDDVEIGANSCVDRGSAQDTVIGPGCRLDNLVQIGHNVRLGRCCVVVAQVGIAGSATIEDFVMIGGQVAIVGHSTIGRGARIGAQAGVIGDIPAGQEWIGSPAMPAREMFRQFALVKRLTARKRTSPETANQAGEP